MSSQKKFLPKLYPLERKIEKTWFVEYTGEDGKKKKLYGKLNHLPTVEERLKEAETLIKTVLDLDIQLPVDNNQLIKDLSEVYELRKPTWKPASIRAYQTHFYAFARSYRANGCPKMDA